MGVRILVFTQYYPPEVGATQNRLHFFATRLAAQGHQVTVVTEVPNHPAGIIFPGFRWRLWRRTVEDQVRVVRVWVKTGPVKTFLVRIGFYLSYACMGTLAALVLTGRRHDLVFASSPPLTVGLPAYVYSRLRRAPLVLDIRDLWPVLAVELGEMRSRRVLALARRLEILLYRHARAITVVTKGFARYVVGQGVPADRVHLLPNGTDARLFRPAAPDEGLLRSLGLDGKFVVGFFGNHGIAQDLEGVVEAARLLANDDRIRWLFVGEGPAKAGLLELKDRYRLANVVFCPQVPARDVVKYINSTDAVVVPLRKLDLFKTFVPSKLFDFMACARPVLLQVDGEAREILEAAGGGLFVPPGDPAALAAAVSALAARSPDERAAMGAAGLAYVHQHYLRDQQTVRLERLLAAVAGPAIAPGARGV